MVKALSLPKYVMPLKGLAIGKGIEVPPIRHRLPSRLVHHEDTYEKYSEDQLERGIDRMDLVLRKEGYYQKYSDKKNEFGWRDHMVGKFGGDWLNIIEDRRLKVLKKQGFLE